MDEMARHWATVRHKDFGYIARTLDRWPDGPPPPTRKPTVVTAAAQEHRDREAAAARAQERLEERHGVERKAVGRGAWDAMKQADQDAMLSRIKDENPGCARFPKMLEQLCWEAARVEAANCRNAPQLCFDPASIKGAEPKDGAR
jgi:hypothetical protein